jgi:thermitase
MASTTTRLRGALTCALALSLLAAATVHAAQVRTAVPNDPLWSRQWGVRAAGGTGLWTWGHGSRGTVVAVLDTGVDAAQPDLRGALVAGWNTLANDADTRDDNGHGTLVTGIVAARGNNKAGIIGYCPACSVMPVKVLDAAGTGSGAAIASGIDWAAAHGADVLNMSFTLDHADPLIESAVARAVARGVLVAAAAGNAGGTDVRYPAGYAGVISVGGVDPAGALYPWSTFGPWATVSMPGCNETTSAGGGYLDFCGSSSATAALSGLLGLAASDAPRARGRLRSLLVQHAVQPTRRLRGLAFLTAARRVDLALRRR